MVAVGPLFALLVHAAPAGWLVPLYPLVFVALGVGLKAWYAGSLIDETLQHLMGAAQSTTG